MGVGIETVLGYLSDANSATAQAMTAGTGQSFSVRAAASPSVGVTLEAIFASFQDQGDFRVRSARMHDNTNGIRIAAPGTVPGVIADEYFSQTLFSQDALTVEAVFTSAPTATHISQAGLQIYYDDLPGIAGNYRPWSGVAPNIVDFLAVPVSPTSGSTAGNWGTGVAINSTVDVFKANTLYALIGFVAPVAFGMWAIQGVDVGNLLVGGPGITSPIDSRRWFGYMEQASGKPSIPIINSQNKGTTNVFVADRVASTAYEITLLFAQLSA